MVFLFDFFLRPIHTVRLPCTAIFIATNVLHRTPSVAMEKNLSRNEQPLTDITKYFNIFMKTFVTIYILDIYLAQIHIFQLNLRPISKLVKRMQSKRRNVSRILFLELYFLNFFQYQRKCK